MTLYSYTDSILVYSKYMQRDWCILYIYATYMLKICVLINTQCLEIFESFPSFGAMSSLVFFILDMSLCFGLLCKALVCSANSINLSYKHIHIFYQAYIPTYQVQKKSAIPCGSSTSNLGDTFAAAEYIHVAIPYFMEKHLN